ncbi:MAG: hypothetical protein HKN05_09920, partial [Rhizobiales bacterium]|nr:hypothetical protein [Hyphomicrobiales bacterium]
MSDKPQTALDLLPTAKDLLKRGMWLQAEVLYRHIAAKDPTQAEVFNDLGIVRACQGALSEAEDFARKAIALNRTSPIYRVNLAKHLFGADRIDDAEAEVYAALALDCRDEAAIEALELMQAHRKQALAKPVEADPIEADFKEPERKTVAAPYRGMLRKSGDEQADAQSIDATLRTQEEQLASAYKSFAQRDYDTVIHKLRSLEADCPGHPLAALWTALCHFRQDDLKRARHWADRAVELAPKDHAAHLASGLISQAQLAFDEAELALNRGIELAPKNADFYSALAFQKLLTGDWPEGWRLFDKVNQALTKFRLGTVQPW